MAAGPQPTPSINPSISNDPSIPVANGTVERNAVTRSARTESLPLRSTPTRQTHIHSTSQRGTPTTPSLAVPALLPCCVQAGTHSRCAAFPVHAAPPSPSVAVAWHAAPDPCGVFGTGVARHAPKSTMCCSAYQAYLARFGQPEHPIYSLHSGEIRDGLRQMQALALVAAHKPLQHPTYYTCYQATISEAVH
jgi:hypothetical protein